MLKNKYRALCIALFVFPMSTLAATLTADDTVAGLGTDIDLTALTPGQQITVVITPPFGNELVTDVQADSTGTAHVQIPGRETEVAGMYTVSLEQDNVVLGTSATFEVLADSAHSANSSISTDTVFIHADGSDTAEVTVILRDRYGNPLANRPVKLISSRSEDLVTALQHETDDNGEQRFAVRTQQSGTLSLRAIDFINGEILSSEVIIDAGGASNLAMGGSTRRPLYGSADTRSFYGSALRAQVTAGEIDHYVIIAPRELQVNEDATIRITAVDADGNRVEDYVGTALLSSTDPAAFLPIGGKVPFRDSDLGEKQLTLGLRFRTAGEHILHAEDQNNPDIMSETIINVTGGTQGETGTKLIKITEPTDNAITNQTSLTITGSAEPFVNLIVTGGLAAVEGETDINGEFAITVDLDPEIETHTLRVKDETSVLDSGDITVKLDVTPPTIHSISLSPDNPVEETDVLLVIETDPDITSLEATLDDEPLVLDKAPGQEGKFQSLFKAPSAGRHEISITITDNAGNSITEVPAFNSNLKGLPKVTGLTAETVGEAVELKWDPITEEQVDAYRVYVGETPTEFAFSLDSDQATTAAQIAGLQPGTDYYFAVTGLKGERESEEKSDVIKATVFGIRLETQAQSNALMLDWSNMQTTIPLSSFILEYGVEPNAYSEKRFLNGELRNYTIRDLINEVTYFVQLTPVSLTGELIEDMIATSEGKPLKTAEGFRPTPADPVPFDVVSQQVAKVTPPPNLHQSAPATPPTGLPSAMWWFVAALAGGAFILQWKRKRTLQQTIAFLESMEGKYQEY